MPIFTADTDSNNGPMMYHTPRETPVGSSNKISKRRSNYELGEKQNKENNAPRLQSVNKMQLLWDGEEERLKSRQGSGILLKK